MTVLTSARVLQYMLDAGFTRDEANMMTVICYYESGYDPRNVSDLSLAKYGSRGLAQIFSGAWSLRDLHINSYDDLFDPATNARCAHVVFKAQGFTAWSTYNHLHTTIAWDKRLAAVAALPGGEPVSKGMTAEELKAAFTRWGVAFVEHAGWTTHNRAGHGDWAPNGLVLHHTGDDAPDSNDEKVLWAGRSDLPGPLCHWGMRDDGTAVLIGNGRANHAGVGSSAVLAAVVFENYGDYPPHPGRDDTDGNIHFYGQETMYSGGKAPDPRAYAATVKAFAAVCEHHGWNAKSCIGHKEWTSRKPDPGHVDMAVFRRDVAAALKTGPAGVKPPTGAQDPVDLSKVIAKATNSGKYDGRVALALKAEGLAATVKGYAKWQQRYSDEHNLHWTGSDLNGIAGKTSLAALGAKYGWSIQS